MGGIGDEVAQYGSTLVSDGRKIRQVGRLLDLIDRCWTAVTALAQSKAKQHQEIVRVGMQGLCGDSEILPCARGRGVCPVLPCAQGAS